MRLLGVAGRGEPSAASQADNRTLRPGVLDADPPTGERPVMPSLTRDRLVALLDRERATYAGANPRSAELHASAEHLFGRVPMTWMNMWSGGFPPFLHRAWGKRGGGGGGHEDVDFALGGTRAGGGHNPPPPGRAGGP